MKSKSWNGLPIVIFGTSGMSKETKCIINEINSNNYEKQYDFIGYIGEDIEKKDELFFGDKIIACDSEFEEFCSKFTQLGVIIPMGTPKIKKKIYEGIKHIKNIVYPNIISPSSRVMKYDTIHIGMGNIIGPGVTITTDIKIGDFNLINNNCTIGHDVIIEDYCVVNPLTAISGNVHIESNVLLGAGSSIKQGITVKENSIVGLGAFIVKDVPKSTIMVCKSAKELKTNDN